MATYPQGVVRDPVDGTYYYKGQAFAFSPEVEAKYSEAENVQLYVDFVNRQEDLGILDTPDPERQARYEQLLNQEQFDRSLPADTAKNSIENNPAPIEQETLSETEQANLESSAEISASLDETGAEATIAIPEAGTELTLDTNTGVTLATPIINVTPTSEEEEEDTPRSQAINDVTEVYTPLDNVLHDYSTYTYGVSLHLLTPDEYNLVVQTEKYIPKRVLVASAGRHNSLSPDDPRAFLRNKYFNRDFYFDNLEISTIIGCTEINRMTNAISVEFTLIEPYGVTFLDNLMNACADADVGGLNYLDMPYLLEIDFFANSDAGEIINKIPNLTKRIPIKINKMDIDISTKGATYKFLATPFNHDAFNSTTVTVPAALTVVAGTVAEFFQTSESTGVPQELADDSRDTGKNTLYRTGLGTFSVGGLTVNANEIPTINLNKTSLSRLRTVSSFGSGINAWFKELRDQNKLATNDEYYFEFDDEIKNSQFTTITNKTTDIKNSRMSQLDRTNSIRLSSATQKGSSDFDLTLKEFQINAGTTIEKVINTIVRSSDYIQKQIILPEDYQDSVAYEQALAATRSEPLKWFKIVPEIRLGEFDPVKKLYKRFITFHVQTYKITNLTTELGPQGLAEYPLKVYDYLYTGNNDSVINVDIKFNALYYNALTAFRSKLTDVSNVVNKAKEEYDIKNPDSYIGTPMDPNGVMPMAMKPVVANQRINAAGQETTAREVASGDLEASLLSMSGADMVNVYLTIVGDPDFIKQDDVFYKPKHLKYIPSSNENQDPRLTPNGSMRTDNGDLHVQLTIRTPIDIDESTGHMVFDSKIQRSVFSGLYKVIKVTSTFAQGKFQQVLHLVRLPRQIKFDYVGGRKGTDTVNRTSDVGQDSDALTLKDNSTVEQVEGLGDEVITNEATDVQATPDTTISDEEPIVDQEQQELINTANNAEEESIVDRINNQNAIQATPPPGVQSAEDAWTDRYIENEAKQSEVTAQLREANREYTTAVQAYNIYGETAFRQDPTLRGRLEKAVADRQRLTSELNQLQTQGEAISANKP